MKNDKATLVKDIDNLSKETEFVQSTIAGALDVILVWFIKNDKQINNKCLAQIIGMLRGKSDNE